MPKKPNLKNRKEESSFKDPSGFVFYHGNHVFRQINNLYRDDFNLLVSSGLAKYLIKNKLLLPYFNTNIVPLDKEGYKVIEISKIPFISYPYEWSFSQLKDAALLTLDIQLAALNHGMILKDASAYNIQFVDYKPVLIDQLSFTRYNEGHPWVAYRQFCQHFLAPLLLISLVDVRFGLFLSNYLDGLPLDLVSRILPKTSFLNFSILSHIHLHAQNLQKFAISNDKTIQKKIRLSKYQLVAIIEDLKKTISKLRLKVENTPWSNYYLSNNYSKQAFLDKKHKVNSLIKLVSPQTVWDFGANIGEFSRLASRQGIFTVAFDLDFLTVEKNYLQLKTNKEKNLLPLVLDLTNPSPDLGWNNQERKSLISRGPCDLLLVLALIHHLAISNNLPFAKIAYFFQQITKYLIIEFVPKQDSQAQRLLINREDIFNKYNQEEFEKEFTKYFKILSKQKVKNSQRTLYLMKKR